MADYGTARELFEAARASARELDRERRTLLKMESREGVKGAGLEAIRASGTSDPMRPTDARMDYEARISRSIAECERIIDFACAVLYGTDYSGRDGGLYSLAEHVMADILCMHYCQDMLWQDVANIVGYSRSQCIIKAAAAMELIDATGIDECIRGKRRDATGRDKPGLSDNL